MESQSHIRKQTVSCIAAVLSVLNNLKKRGVEDILIICVDGLSGFPDVTEAAYPKAEIQKWATSLVLCKPQTGAVE